MPYRPPRATKYQSRLETELASEFDATILHNKVCEDIVEDDELAQHCDALAATEQARDKRDAEHGHNDNFAESIDDVCGQFETIAQERAREVAAEACATVLRDGDQWADEGHWEQGKVDEAKLEATEWLTTNTNISSRLGLLEEVEE